MSIPRITKAMDYIGDDLVADAIEYKRTKNKNTWVKWVQLAACLVLVVALGIPLIRSITSFFEKKQSKNVIIHGYTVTRTLEKTLSYTTDILEGKCIDSYKGEDGNIHYTFKCLNSYYGDTEGDEISVIGYDYKTVYDGKEVYSNKYQNGSDYLLVLTFVPQVYQKSDYYQCSDDFLFIDKDDPEKSTMYGQPITKHSELKTVGSFDQLISYMIQCAEEGEKIYRDYIRSDDIGVIAQDSPYILTVKVLNKDDKMISGKNVSGYVCQVEHVFKSESSVGGVITVLFNDNDVKVGSSYILCLYKEGSAFIFASKTNMFDISIEDTITELVNGAE